VEFFSGAPIDVKKAVNEFLAGQPDDKIQDVKMLEAAPGFIYMVVIFEK